MSALGTGLAYVDLAQSYGVLVALGYADGQAFVQRSDDGGASLLTFNDGSTSKLVATADASRHAVASVCDGSLAAVLSVSGVPVAYLSYDGGETWQQGVAVP